MEKRSLGAHVVEKLLKIRNSGCFDSTENADAHMKERSLVEDLPYTLPNKRYASEVRLTEFGGRQIVRFSPSEKAERIVLYIHGGAYVHEMSPQHIGFCDRICTGLNADVVAPIYGLAPNHTCEEAYELVTSLYLEEKKKGLPMVMMGDSAGGGFVAGFVQDLSHQGIEPPEKVCLMSPWVDITMPSDYSKLQKVDPMLDAPGLREIGSIWAGDMDVKDPRVSPIYGDLSDFPESLLFVGTHEIFCDDVQEFHRKLVQSGRPSQLIVGTGMNHVYPLLPIPEAKEAMRTIVGFIADRHVL